MDTSKNNDMNILKYKGFDSIYDRINECRWKTKNEGYDYRKTLTRLSSDQESVLC